jgi:hypothetical protein
MIHPDIAVINYQALFLYSLTLDDLLFLKSTGVELSEREETRLDDFLWEATCFYGSSDQILSARSHGKTAKRVLVQCGCCFCSNLQTRSRTSTACTISELSTAHLRKRGQTVRLTVQQSRGEFKWRRKSNQVISKLKRNV